MGIVLAPLAFEQASAQTVGLKEGQWAKYIPSCNVQASAPNDELEKKLENDLEKQCYDTMKERFGVAGANNVEWLKVKVSKIDGNKVTFDTSIKVKGSVEKSMGSSINDIVRNAGFPVWAIPVGLGVGDQISTPENYSPLRVYEIGNMWEFPSWKKFENVEFLHLISDNTIMQGGNEVQLYADFWFERSTGILLENEIGMFVWDPEKSAWADISTNLELLDFSSGGIKVQEKTDLDSLSFKEAEMKIANLEGSGRYIINKTCCDNMGDDSIVNKYEILTVNHEEIGMLQIEGKDKVGVIWATSYFDFAQGGATRDDANDIILEVQIQFVPESKAISPMFPETKKVGSKTIKLDSRQTTTFGTTWVEFTLMIDYGTVGFVPTQPPIETSKMPTQEVVAAIVPEQVDSADTDILGYGLGMAIVIGVTVIVCLLIIRLKKKTKNTQQEPSSAIQQQIEQDQTLRYDSSLRKRTNLWYLVPSLAGVIGGIIAYFILRKDDPKKAKNCLYLSVAVTAIGIIINLVI